MVIWLTASLDWVFHHLNIIKIALIYIDQMTKEPRRFRKRSEIDRPHQLCQSKQEIIWWPCRHKQDHYYGDIIHSVVWDGIEMNCFALYLQSPWKIRDRAYMKVRYKLLMST